MHIEKKLTRQGTELLITEIQVRIESSRAVP